MAHFTDSARHLERKMPSYSHAIGTRALTHPAHAFHVDETARLARLPGTVGGSTLAAAPSHQL